MAPESEIPTSACSCMAKASLCPCSPSVLSFSSSLSSPSRVPDCSHHELLAAAAPRCPPLLSAHEPLLQVAV
eukprot:6073105-Pleurochrysis_carterae.AAC.1